MSHFTKAFCWDAVLPRCGHGDFTLIFWPYRLQCLGRKYKYIIIYEALGTKISHPAHAENSPKRRREVFGYLLVYSPPPLARAKFEHFYPESKGDRDTVFKRIPICVQPAQNCQIDWGEPDD